MWFVYLPAPRGREVKIAHHLFKDQFNIIRKILSKKLKNKNRTALAVLPNMAVTKLCPLPRYIVSRKKNQKKSKKKLKKIKKTFSKKRAGSPHPSEHLFRLTVFLVHLPNVHHGTIHASIHFNSSCKNIKFDIFSSHD